MNNKETTDELVFVYENCNILTNDAIRKKLKGVITALERQEKEPCEWCGEGLIRPINLNYGYFEDAPKNYCCNCGRELMEG